MFADNLNKGPMSNYSTPILNRYLGYRPRKYKLLIGPCGNLRFKLNVKRKTTEYFTWYHNDCVSTNVKCIMVILTPVSNNLFHYYINENVINKLNT